MENVKITLVLENTETGDVLALTESTFDSSWPAVQQALMEMANRSLTAFYYPLDSELQIVQK